MATPLPTHPGAPSPLATPSADGRWCTVDQAYQGLLLELALLTAVEHGWPLSALPGEALAAALQPHGYDPRVSLHCLASFGTRLGGGGGGDAIDDGPSSSQQQGGAASARADAAPMDADGAAAAGGAAAAAGGGGGGVYCLDEAAVCLHFARSLLAAQPDWILEEFETAWQLAVPEVGGQAGGREVGAARWLAGNRALPAATVNRNKQIARG